MSRWLTADLMTGLSTDYEMGYEMGGGKGEGMWILVTKNESMSKEYTKGTVEWKGKGNSSIDGGGKYSYQEFND